MTCPICGAEFERRGNGQKYCSRKCLKVAESRRWRREHGCQDLVAGAHQCATLVSNKVIILSRRKPKGVSDIRWRMELRRRLNPERYAYAEVV